MNQNKLLATISAASIGTSSYLIKPKYIIRCQRKIYAIPTTRSAEQQDKLWSNIGVVSHLGNGRVSPGYLSPV